MNLHALATAFAFLVAPVAVSAQTGPIARAITSESARLARGSTQNYPATPLWQRVRDIERDVRVVVTTRDDGVLIGAFVAADAFAITIDRENRIVQIQADNVVEVKSVQRHIGRGIGIGAAIGGALLMATMMYVDITEGSHDGLTRASPLIYMGAGMGIGAAVGAREFTHVVYRVPKAWERTQETAWSSR